MPNIFDFNPTRINPFPYWKWNKVLPAVYDDSLSQYEILCKLLDVVNNIITSTNSTGEQVEQLTQLVQQLIDGEFPSGLVQYVKDIVDAAMADDIEAINEAINNMQTELDGNKIVANLVAPQANNAPWRLVDIFRTYIPHNDRFVYGGGSFLGMTYDSTNDTYSPTTIRGVSDGGVNKFYASCSTAVEACLMGIPYENSRMATGIVSGNNPPLLSGGTNTPVSGQYAIDIYNEIARNKYSENPSNGYIYASGLAHMFYDIGCLREIKSTGNFSELAAGDIVFWVQHSEESERYWNGIGHVAIYLGPYYTGCYVAEITTTSPMWQFRQRPLVQLQSLKYYARIPMDSNIAPINLLKETYPIAEYPSYQYSGASPSEWHALPFDNRDKNKLEPNNIYTIVMHINDVVGDNVRFTIQGARYDGTAVTRKTNVIGSVAITNPQAYLGNNTYWGIIKTPDTSDIDFTTNPCNGIFFRGYADSTNMSYTINNIQVYDRLIQPSSMFGV